MDPPLTTTTTTTTPQDVSSEEVPLALGGGKLRLMCSYGGHIVPRPHDKTLCYIGGDTRMVVADRSTSLSSLCSRLSRTLLNSRPFTLKYQLPSEDLDSLISVATDDDLDNMIDEYDRANPTSRLRLFLFAAKPQTSLSMGALLQDATSETWFVDALNGSPVLPRGLSDSAVLSLDSPPPPSTSNLPPIRVRVPAAERRSIEEQFAQISFTPPVSAPVAVSDKDLSEDERSDHGGGGGGGGSATAVFRKPPLPLQPKLGGGNGHGLPSPDSVTSDNSVTSSSSQSKQMYYQDQQQQQQQQYAPPPRENSDSPGPGTHLVQQQKDSSSNYLLQPHLDQYQQFVPVSSYYQIYPQTPQQYHHHPIDHQYPAPPPAPLYVMSTQPYNVVDNTTTNRPPKPHYLGLSQFPHHPSQSGSHSYTYEYANPGPNTAPHDHQVYYAPPPPMPSQYQSMTPAAAIALSEAAKQLPPPDNNTAPQQQMRNPPQPQ